MKVAIFGTGYVGLVTGVGLAEKGHQVLCVDIDQAKVNMLRSGKSPIYEPGLDELLAKNIAAERIAFTTEPKFAVNFSNLIMIAVGTPPNEDGSADLSHVLDVSDTIARYMREDKIIITKSTVPVGTHLKVLQKMRDVLEENDLNLHCSVVSNPEFLREGCAVEDCLRPARIVVGTDSVGAAMVLQELYNPFITEGVPYIVMDPLSSEMTKYAANAMLAARISIMNEFSRLCEKVGANIDQVKHGIGSDPRIGHQFLNAGLGYGGSCFPKDVKALIRTGQEYDEPMAILKAVETVNQQQRELFFRKVKLSQYGHLQGRKVAVWGIAFKPGTDDVREAPAIDLIERLQAAGANVIAYDPVVNAKAHDRLKECHNLEFTVDKYDALADADVLCICTEWLSFREPDFSEMKLRMKSPIIVDGRNLFSQEFMENQGFTYYSMGRPDLEYLEEMLLNDSDEEQQAEARSRSHLKIT